MTRRARRAHGPSVPGWLATFRTASESIRVPTMARIAGSSVIAARTARPTTIAPAMPHRAQDHELEQDEAEEAQQDGQPGEEHRAAGRRHRDPHRLGDTIVPVALASSSRKRLVISSE